MNKAYIAARKQGEEGFETCSPRDAAATEFEVRPHGNGELDRNFAAADRAEAERLLAAFEQCFQAGRTARQFEIRSILTEPL